MIKFNSEILSRDSEDLIFNAFSRERFFHYEDPSFELTRMLVSVDKMAGIDEMLSDNITELTHRARQE